MSLELSKPRSSARQRLSSTRVSSTTTLSTSSKTPPSRASSSKVTLNTETTGSPFISSGYWTRRRLQVQWDKATREAGSASVMIVNEVDGEEVPGVPEDFRYLEYGYDWGRHAPDPNFLIGCDCVGNCGSADSGGCCIKHIDSDPSELWGFWYDKQGLFRLGTTHMLLRECNVNCSCDETCRTRVAQKPRKIPLQVFKTSHCGWGVRPAVRVLKGTLIGLYSGVLLKRWEADGIQGERKNYIFDLDHNKFGEEGPIQNQYSVDGYTKGNWGRFINHSCDPNMQVLPAMFDAPEIEKSYLVFVATKDIREGVELTIDYHPNLGAPTRGKGKGKRKRRGSDACMCSAKLCRGIRP
ncbi:SET domain-containing protein [Thelephora ganbajun]|uniref:SET domain-containing protein n=1 Tax=Thelephora ganbajun TaxID=370292 RepID=A0ACB6ZWP9_THEGA|nr:SET domain-containing protein [Thelephora ganbajun]